MIILFALGYMCIALEHRIKIDKSATALAMFAVIWSVYALASGDADTGSKLLEHLGSTCETLVFLIGAMTIVDLIDRNGGFSIITDHITSRNKITLLWTLAFITFFMSAVLDNMTTTIIMIMMLRKLVPTLRDRWIYAGVIIIAANTGGAWSPIGDVTTIMLWMRGNVTAGSLILYLMVPCLVSMVIPVVMAMRKLRGGTLMLPQVEAATPLPRGVGKRFSRGVLCLGVAGLLFVPVFKSLTAFLLPFCPPLFRGLFFSASSQLSSDFHFLIRTSGTPASFASSAVPICPSLSKYRCNELSLSGFRGLPMLSPLFVRFHSFQLFYLAEV